MSESHGHGDPKPDDGDPNRWKDDSWSVFALKYSKKAFWITLGLTAAYVIAVVIVIRTM